MTDAGTNATRGGCLVRPDGEYVGLRPEPTWAGTAGAAPSAALAPDFTPPPESGHKISDAAFTLTGQPPLVAIRYRSRAGDLHVAIGWLTLETDTHYRLSGDLTLYNEDAKLKVTGELPPNHVPKGGIITMFEVTADGAGQLIACWGNPKIVRKRS